MSNYRDDKRIVLTLDAGGTNFVFSAIQGGDEVIEPIVLPSSANKLDKCLETISEGFRQAKDMVKGSPAAISFAFPGPADYPNGIIGDLNNLPAFRGGVALGPMLNDQFDIPVFINNDGDLFAYGEAIGGFLPKVNRMLEEAGNEKRYNNLLGITLGTGFGAGIVRNGELFIGDNAAGAEIWCLRNRLYPELTAEESVSIRGVRRVYARETDTDFGDAPEPRVIFDIANGDAEGDRQAAKAAFAEMGRVIGDALANVITMIDGLIVMGGGLAKAHSIFLPALIDEMNSTINNGEDRRTVLKAFNLENDADREAFAKGNATQVQVPGSDRMVHYDPLKRVGVGNRVLKTSRAVSVGAYAFALHELDR